MTDRAQPDLYDLFQQIGGLQAQMSEVAKSLAEMRGVQEARHAENRENINKTTQKVSDFKHEVNGRAQRSEFRMEKIEKAANNVQEAVDKLDDEVRKLRQPVDEMVALRKRVGAVGAALFSIAAAIWFFAAPLWTFFYQKIIVDWFGGHH